MKSQKAAAAATPASSLLLKDLAAHPLCEMVPGGLTEEEHTALVEDLKANGMRIPIVMYEGKVLDGRARYRAATSAGVEVRHETFEGDADAARQFVMSANLHRRTLTGMQKALAVAEVYKRAVAHDGPKPSQEQMAKRYGVSKQTLSLCLKAIESKNTMLLTRMRRGEVTRGELEEEFYDRDAANTKLPTRTDEAHGDIFGAAPLPGKGIDIPPMLGRSSSEDSTPAVAQRSSERRTTETVPSKLAQEYKALSEQDRISFVALAWPWLESVVLAHQTTHTARTKAKATDPAPKARARAKAA